MASNTAHVPLVPVSPGWLDGTGVELAVLRLDLTDPVISGNKPFKLAGYLDLARATGATTLISLGGAHSNHLHALAAVGNAMGLRTVGLLRGHRCETPTVRDLETFGMELHWLGYGSYRARHAADFWTPWQARYPGAVMIPEGGGGALGANGCGEILTLLDAGLDGVGWSTADEIWLPVGTGTTLAGLVLAGASGVVGAVAVPEGYGVPENIASILGEQRRADSPYRLVDASRKGFAKRDEALNTFMVEFGQSCDVPLEPIYTGKALMALRDAVINDGLASGSRVVFIHTGGLQARRGFGLNLP
ncbi:1-aminocyclopropane-1-carboxylate deaminase/D-cysteine desulfhydrase [Pseudomonas sp. Marseille-QA0892]